MSKNNSHILLSSKSNIKEQILFSSKSQKELILSLIKSGQLSLLSKINQKAKISQKEKLIIFKNYLKDLKSNLSYILKEKTTNMIYLQNKINNTKQIIQNKISNNNKDNDDKNINEDYLETDMKEKNYEGNELSKLQFLNFKIENEIQKTNNMIANMQYLIKSLKLTYLFPEDNIKFSLLNNLQNPKEIAKIYNSKIQYEKKILDKYIDLQNQQKYYLELYQNKINEIKNKIRTQQFMGLNEIIYEESLENRDSEGSPIDINNMSNDSNIESVEEKNNINISSESDCNNIKCKNNILNLNMNIYLNLNINSL